MVYPLVDPVNQDQKDMEGILLPDLTLRLLMSYIYGAPSKARNADVVYIYIYRVSQEERT